MDLDNVNYSSTQEEENSIVQIDLDELVRHGRSVELDAYLLKHPHACNNLTIVHKLNNDYLSLLMLAALNGHDAVVRVILSRCPADVEHIELQGRVHSVSGDLVNNATALWCALDRAHYTVARTLIDLGKANVDHGSADPLLIDATDRGRFDTVHFLVENGYVDVNRTVTNDEHKWSSLIVSATQGHTQIVAHLIERGAEIDYKTQVYRNTPLTFAAMKGHVASMKVLCLAGASVNVKNRYGKTPLMLAAENGHPEAIDFLLEYNHDETAFNDLELVASSHMISDNNDPHHGSEWMMRLLRMSLERRALLNTPKIVAQPIAAYDFQQECRSIDELNQIHNDNDRLYIEALLIQERILLPQKNKTLFTPLRKRVILLAARRMFDRCLHLLCHTFHLYQQMELPTKLPRFVWVFCRMLTAQVPIPADQFLETCRLTFESSQQKPDEFNIRNTLYLVAIAAKVLEQTTLNIRDRCSIIQWIKDLCRERRTTEKGQNLLHLSVDVQSFEYINYRPADIRPVLNFPNLAATRLLIAYGGPWIDLHAVDRVQGDTALHVLSRSSDITAIAELLINAGAHVDCVNHFGKTPLDEAVETKMRTFLRSKQTPPQLKCLCARLITDQKLAYDCLWPEQTELNTFLLLHNSGKTNRSVSES